MLPMNPDLLPPNIVSALKAFTLTQAWRLLTRQPNLIVLADPGASAASAGLFPLLDALAAHFAFPPPAVVVMEAGYGAYSDLLDAMRDDGLAAHDTVTHQGLVIQEQRRYLRRALRGGRDVGRLTPVYAELVPLLAGLFGHRPGATLHLQVLVDIELAEDPRPWLVRTVVHAAAPSTCRVVCTLDEVAPAPSFWQDQVVGDEYADAFVARYWDQQDRFDPEQVAALDEVIAELIQAATAAWLPTIIETMKRQAAS